MARRDEFDIGTFLFSLQGRATRYDLWVRFWLPYLGLALLGAVLDVATASKAPSSLISLLTLWPSLAVAVRRCHDRDRSGWFVLMPLVPFVPLVALFFALFDPVARDVQLPGLLLSMLAIQIGCGLWYFIETGLLRGTDGPNRFGPDPLG